MIVIVLEFDSLIINARPSVFPARPIDRPITVSHLDRSWATAWIAPHYRVTCRLLEQLPASGS